MRLSVRGMSGGNAHAHGDSAHHLARIPICPACGECDAIESNLIDETPYQEAAEMAPMLRSLGAVRLATDILTSLASVEILNWARENWRCACGATFDE